MATNPMWGWEQFFDELCSFLHSIQRQYGVANEPFTYYALERIEISCHGLETLLHQMRTFISTGGRLDGDDSATVVEYCALLAELIQCLHSTAHEWQSYLDRLLELPDMRSYLASTSLPIGCGRPKFHIPKNQLEYLASMSFNWTQIASMLGVSQMTIYRRRLEYGLSSSASGNLSDDELRVILGEIRRDQPKQ